MPASGAVMGVVGAPTDKWWNRVYVVVRRQCEIPDIVFAGRLPGDFWHLQIWRQDRKRIHRWADLQRIKNELVSVHAEGIELYPAESRLVNQAHVYHLWVLTGVRVPIGTRRRMVK